MNYLPHYLTSILIFFIALLSGCTNSDSTELLIKHVQTWDTTGTELGKLQHPIGITLHDGLLYISDAGNHRIHAFEKDGTHVRSFGSKGSETGQLNRPMHLEFGRDTLFVPEYLNDRIQLFLSDGNSLQTIGESGTGKGQFDAPGGVAVDTNRSTLFVADFYNHTIHKFSTGGNLITQFGKGEYGSEPGVFTYPTDVALLNNGDVVVADAYNNRIQLLNKQGEVKWIIPENTTEADSLSGRFDVATAVATDHQNRIYVADFENHRIQIFSQNGTFLTMFGQKGTNDSQFERPTDIVIDKDGNIYVVDFGNKRIQKFRIQKPL